MHGSTITPADRRCSSLSETICGGFSIWLPSSLVCQQLPSPARFLLWVIQSDCCHLRQYGLRRMGGCRPPDNSRYLYWDRTRLLMIVSDRCHLQSGFSSAAQPGAKENSSPFAPAPLAYSLNLCTVCAPALMLRCEKAGIIRLLRHRTAASKLCRRGVFYHPLSASGSAMLWFQTVILHAASDIGGYVMLHFLNIANLSEST